MRELSERELLTTMDSSGKIIDSPCHKRGCIHYERWGVSNNASCHLEICNFERPKYDPALEGRGYARQRAPKTGHGVYGAWHGGHGESG